MQSLRTFLEHHDFTKIKMKLTKTNHFELSASINGTTGRFILDTGASNTCIGLDKVRHFALTPTESDIKAAGAGASAMDTFVADGNTITIGAWTKRRQKIVIFDLVHVNQALVHENSAPVDGIIGADLLKKGKAIIDYGKKVLYLKR